MTHDDAIKGGATERYVLDQMEEEERDAFEDHYFDCVICAEDVKAAVAIRDNLAAERVAAQPAVIPIEPHRQRRLATPIASIAASLALVLFGWAQFVRLPEISTRLAAAERPYAPPEPQPVEPERGSRKVYDLSHGPIALDVAMPAALHRPTPYQTEILGSRLTAPLRFSTSDDHQRIIIPSGGLAPGDYTIRVTDAHGTFVYEIPITIR